jgi:hypothetical protein
MKLSIIVPTNKRFRLAELTAKTTREIFKDYRDVEVILSDSSPSKGCVAPDNVTLIHCPESFDSAEEHFFWAMPYAHGEYIWILGDDDSINLRGAILMYEMICKNEADFFLFNQHCFVDGKIKTGNIQCSSPEKITSMHNYVLRAGMWYGLAGISNAVFKRPNSLEHARFKAIRDLNPIYSHVVWFLYTFKDRPFKYINTPIVNYTMSDTRWPEWCKAHDVSGSFPWTIGFMRQIKFLRQVYGPESFKDIMGAEWLGTRQKQIVFSATLFMNDCLGYESGARALTCDEIKEYTDWIIAEDPIFTSMFPCTKETQDATQSLVQDYYKNPLHSNFIERYRYFNIYLLHGDYIAISITAMEKMDVFLSDLTPCDLPFFFVAETIEDVRIKVDKAVSWMCVDLHASTQNNHLSKLVNLKQTSLIPYTKPKTWHEKIKGWFV